MRKKLVEITKIQCFLSYMSGRIELLKKISLVHALLFSYLMKFLLAKLRDLNKCIVVVYKL